MSLRDNSNRYAVSFVIPAFNAERYLRRAVETAIAVPLRKQILIIDDGSQDSTYQIASELEAANKDEVSCISHSENRGLSAARNTGLSLSSGKYVFFLDSDDAVYPNGVKALYVAAEKFDLDMVHSPHLPFSNTAEEAFFESKGSPQSLVVLDGKEFLERSCSSGRPAVQAWGKLYRRDFIDSKQISFIDGIVHEDFPFFVKCALNACRVGEIDNICYAYRAHSESIMHSIQLSREKAHASAIGRVIGCEEVLKMLSRRDEEYPALNGYIAYQLKRAVAYAPTRVRALALRLLMRHKLPPKKVVVAAYAYIRSFLPAAELGNY